MTLFEMGTWGQEWRWPGSPGEGGGDKLIPGHREFEGPAVHRSRSCWAAVGPLALPGGILFFFFFLQSSVSKQVTVQEG